MISKKKYKKDRESIIKIFHKMRKLKKDKMLTIEIKIRQTWIEEEGKNVWKLLLYKKDFFELLN